MEVKYCYIEKKQLNNGYFQIEGHSATGTLLFGFRCEPNEIYSWANKARDYTPKHYIPVFDKRYLTKS